MSKENRKRKCKKKKYSDLTKEERKDYAKRTPISICKSKISRNIQDKQEYINFINRRKKERRDKQEQNEDSGDEQDEDSDDEQDEDNDDEYTTEEEEDDNDIISTEEPEDETSEEDDDINNNKNRNKKRRTTSTTTTKKRKRKRKRTTTTSKNKKQNKRKRRKLSKSSKKSKSSKSSRSDWQHVKVQEYTGDYETKKKKDNNFVLSKSGKKQHKIYIKKDHEGNYEFRCFCTAPFILSTNNNKEAVICDICNATFGFNRTTLECGQTDIDLIKLHHGYFNLTEPVKRKWTKLPTKWQNWMSSKGFSICKNCAVKLIKKCDVFKKDTIEKKHWYFVKKVNHHLIKPGKLPDKYIKDFIEYNKEDPSKYVVKPAHIDLRE